MNNNRSNLTRLNVGGDVAKASCVVGLWTEAPGQVLATLSNERSGFEQLASQVQQAHHRCGARQVRLVLEPTAGYELP